MRIYFGPGRWFEEASESAPPENWHGFEFHIEQTGAPTKTYRVQMEDLDFLPQATRQQIIQAVAGRLADLIAQSKAVIRHMNG